MSNYRLLPVEPIRRAMDALERFANDTLAGRNSAHELRELLAAGPVVQREHYDRVPDWSKAPEGATHWSPDTDKHYAAWYREKDGEWEFWLCHNDWSWDYAGIVSDRILIPRPETEWIPNNGLEPDLPDGTLVQVMFANGRTDDKYTVDSWGWAQDGDSYDITHYRIHQPVPDVQGEPAAWQREDKPDRIITKLSRRSVTEVDSGVEFIPLYPPERHPDVSALVEALEVIQRAATHDSIQEGTALGCIAAICDDVLAAYRKGGQP